MGMLHSHKGRSFGRTGTGKRAGRGFFLFAVLLVLALAGSLPSTAKASDDAAYTLYLTHYIRFTVNGQARNVQAQQALRLTEADFPGGVCDLTRYAADVPQLTVTEAKPLSIEAFGVKRECGARIVYAVNDGWRVVPASMQQGTVLRDVFNGALSDYAFVPADIVRINVNYEYSKTGGLAGINAADPAVVEGLPVQNTDGTYSFTCEIPSLSGFRVVLDSTPLDHYLVNPPTGHETAEELKQMLERGDFSVDITKGVYHPNGQNPTYKNVYSDEYNNAWNNARILEKTGSNGGYRVEAISGTHIGSPTAENHGANALVNPHLRVTLTEQQLAYAKNNGLSFTVYYRRNATWYTVKHWVPTELANLITDDTTGKDTKTDGNVTYVLLDTDTLQGRVGGLTNASAKIEGGYALLSPLPFSQQLIKNSTDQGGTTVDIFYRAADAYRIIFDTDYTYIPRQQRSLGQEVDFDNMPEPQRQGYQFAGWRYLKKGATRNENGSYNDDDYIKVAQTDAGNYKLIITAELIADQAQLTETHGVLALHLYPIWKPAQTKVTVILWTEDLTGADDVQAVAEGGNPAYYNEKYKDYQDEPKTHPAKMGENNANYSNVCSFTMEVTTDSSLVDADGKLLPDIQKKVTENFKGNAKGASTGADASAFYQQQDMFEILHESNGQMDYSTTTANADGNTMIYVYFTRNIYTLKFHYYGTATVNSMQSDYCIAYDTNGFSYGGVENILTDGELNFAYYKGYNDPVTKRWMQNKYARPANVNKPGDMPVPQTITIKAKYGADLRSVWPAALNNESVKDADSATTYSTVSWATTAGKYREDAVKGTSHAGEPTIMGLYATMDNEIIAAPTNTNTVHHLVAYWYGNLSYYRYNHCFEVPELNLDTADNVVKIVLYNANSNSQSNFLYLVPTNNPSITKFGFNDLMTVSYENGKITYGVPGAPYYAVRQHNGKCYAIGRQVNAASSNWIEAQNPSPRQHMNRVNTVADHTTQYKDTDGRTWEQGHAVFKDPANPYDLYFYYKRERYTIHYMVTNTRGGELPAEYELGHIELPFGAYVTEQDYAFNLDQHDNNHNKDKYLWTWPDGIEARPVCPDRAENGTANWLFKGWGLGPAGVNMQWEIADPANPAVPQGQAERNFYIDSNLLLYAIWGTPTYTVTFHLNGGTVSDKDNSLIVHVPANMRFTAVGTIPRPVRMGYQLVGWFNSDDQGRYETDAAGQPLNPFDFDEAIISDRHVAAAWVTDRTELYSYTVYYVTPTLDENDQESHDPVQIQNDAIVESGGTTHYVLGKEVYVDQAYAPNIILNLTAKPQGGYIPVATNKTLTLADKNQKYVVIFYYQPQQAAAHTVRFVEAGTEGTANPTIVLSPMNVEADQTVVTPDAQAVTNLTNFGYRLVNRNVNGTYTPVTAYQTLTWLDGQNQTHALATLTGNNIPAIITYLVEPIPYTIAYENAAGSPLEAGAKLDAVTAQQGTPVNNALAQGKNPTQYTTKDTFTLRNPSLVYSGGKVYQFSHWSLGKGTTVKAPTGTPGEYTTLKVDQGTVGNLIFVANWTEMTDMGDLTVSKTVSGNSADTQRGFSFTVRLSDNTLTGKFGEMDFQNGEATFTLKHGESITAAGLPGGIRYTVTENDYTGYIVTASGDTGVIEPGKAAVASFNNQLDPTGPANPNLPDLPQTGDNSRLTLYLALLCVSLLAILAQSAPRRRSKGK